MNRKFRFNPASFTIVVVLIATAAMQVKGPMMVPLIPAAPYLTLFLQTVLPIALAWRLRWTWSRPFTFIALNYLWLIALLGLSLLSAISSPAAGLTIQRALMIWIPSLFLAAFVWADSQPERTLLWVTKGVWAFALFLAAVGVLLSLIGKEARQGEIYIQYIGFGPIRISQQLIGIPPFYRISSLAGNANALAYWCALGIGCMLYLRLVSQLSLRWMVISSVLLGAALVLTFSRGGIVSTIVIVGLHALVQRHRPAAIATVVTGFVLLGTWLYLQSWDVGGRFAVDLNYRQFVWEPLYASFEQRVVSGVGFGVSQEAILEPRGLELSGHNGHLIILSELGIVGYLLVLMLWLAPGIFLLAWGRRSSSCVPLRMVVVVLAWLYFTQFFEGWITRWGFHTLYWVYLCMAGVHPGILQVKSHQET